MAFINQCIALMCLNLIGERDVLHLKNCTYIFIQAHLHVDVFCSGQIAKDIIIFGSIVDGFLVLSI